MQRNTYYIDEKVEKEKVDVKLLRRLLRYVAPRKKTFGIILVLLLSATPVSYTHLTLPTIAPV